MDDQQLSKQLQSVSVPKHLAGNLKKITQQSRPKTTWVSWVAGISMVILLGMMGNSFIKVAPNNPALVVAALEDIQKDSQLDNGLTQQQRSWLISHQVQLPPNVEKVKMSKHCIVSGYVTSHLRIAGERQGVANIFLYPGDLNLPEHAGKIQNLNWVSLKVNQGMSLLVMYTDDMRKKGVNTILQSMFPNEGIILT